MTNVTDSVPWGVVRRLRAAIGPGSVLDTLRGVVVRPTGREEARRTVEILADARVPWRPRGSGRRPSRSRAVEVTAPEGILDVWTDELVARVGCGTRLDDLERGLAPMGLELGVAAPRPSRATIGGIFASGDRGLHGATGRGLRERTLGATLVDGAGRLVRSGGRVVKNVAGFDLTRIHAGAAGSLGLLLDMTVRLQARPPERSACFLAGDLQSSLDRLVELRELASDTVGEIWLDAEAAQAAGCGSDGGLLLLREGESGDLERWRLAIGGESTRADERVRDLGWPADDRAADAGWVLRWCAPPSALRRLGPGATAGGRLVHDLLAGEGWWSAPPDLPLPRVLRCAEGMAATAGSVWLERGPRVRDAPRLARPRSAIESRVRQVFDPLRLLPEAPRPLRAGEEAP